MLIRLCILAILASTIFAVRALGQVPEPTAPEPAAKTLPQAGETASPPGATPEAPDTTAQQGNDTYNFYFQKSPGANEVHQGKEQSVAPAPDEPEGDDAPEAEPAGKSAVAAPLPPQPPSRFHLYTGLFFVPHNSGAGMNFGGQFNMSESFGAQMGLFAFGYEVGGGSHEFSTRGRFDDSTEGEVTGGAVGMTYSPFTGIGDKVHVQGLLGAMFLSDRTERTIDTFSTFGSKDTEISSSQSMVLPYAGIEGIAAISRGMGVGGFARITSKVEYSQIGVSLIWRL